MKQYNSTTKKAKLVRQIVAEHYEQGRQDRCMRWVYLTKVRPLLGISERTFYRYMGELYKEEKEPPTQLTLPFE